VVPGDLVFYLSIGNPLGIKTNPPFTSQKREPPVLSDGAESLKTGGSLFIPLQNQDDLCLRL
jgi:hypothetical protein